MPDNIQRLGIIRADTGVIAKYSGGTIKRLNERAFEGHIIRWHDPQRMDLTGEWFSQRTYLMKNAGYPIIGAPINYQHGMQKDFGSLAIGLIKFTDEDEIGQFVSGELKTREDYIAMLQEIGRKADVKFSDAQLARKSDLAIKAVDTLIASVPLQFSGGFDPSTWQVDPQSKHIDQSGVIHAAFTPTPADDLNPQIQFKSAWDEVLKYESTASYSFPSMQPDPPQTREDETTRKGAVGTEPEPTVPANDGLDNQAKQGSLNMDPETLAAVARAVAQEVLAGIAPMLAQQGQAPESLPAEAEVVSSLLKDQTADPNANPEDLTKAMAEKATKFVLDALEKRRQTAANAKNIVDAHLKRTLPAIDELPGAGGGNGFGHSGSSRIEVTNMKFAHLSPLDLAMAVKMAIAFAPRSLVPLAQRNVSEIMSEELYKHAVHAMEKYHANHELKRPEEQMALKSVRPWKAGELDSSVTTGAGLEYVAYGYDAQVWELARNKPIYELMRSRGMMEKPVPQGQKGVYVPLEGVDPTVYGGSEAVDLDSAGNPETVYQITPYGTANQLVQPGIFRVATGITDILEEDSLVDNVAEANRKIRLALEEHMEKAMLLGDTTTTASTNINSIDGTPTASGLTKSYYLEFNGLMKSPLVSSTAYSRNAGGVLSLNDFLETLYLMPAEQNSLNEGLFFVIDSFVRKGSLKFPELKTRDTAEGEATVFTGVVPALWGIPVFTSGHLTKANTAGKVATTTPSNNTTGRILCVYAPYWAFTYKRQINIESMRFPQSETTGFYGSMRFSLTRRSASASSISYNVAV